VDWQLDALGQQVGPHRGEILDLQSRVDWSERVVSQHERDIKQTRYEVASTSAHLERRIVQLERRTRKSERLIEFLSDVLTGLVAVLFAGLAATYMDGDIYAKGAGAIFVFAGTILAGHFVFIGLAVPWMQRSTSTSHKPTGPSPPGGWRKPTGSNS
jgi:hypothetical protein